MPPRLRYKSKKKAFTKYAKKYEDKGSIERELEDMKQKVDETGGVIRAICHTQVRRVKNLKSKKAHLMEIQVNGSPSGQGADAIRLSEQINQILNGYAGTLPEGTIVSSCFQSDVIDIFDDAVRVYQRKMEYEINYSD